MTIKSFIIEHKNICEEIYKFNEFGKTIYLIIILTVIPMHLCLSHQFLFEDIEPVIKILFFFIIIIEIYTIFFFQCYFASLSSKLHKCVKILSRLQWSLNGWPFAMRPKLKLLIYFERLSSDRKIGIIIGPLGVMTYPLFCKVILFVLLFAPHFVQHQKRCFVTKHESLLFSQM